VTRQEALDAFYSTLEDLTIRLNGCRYLKDCTGKSGWPQRGIYFFFEDGEFRADGATPRVVRVGTHAVSLKSKTTLWDRLRTHRGHSDGRGNHRGSIFRKRVGESILRTGSFPQHLNDTWGRGSSALKSVREAEKVLELEVSRYIGRMPLLWIDVDDAPSKDSFRAYLERNSIALLSNFRKSVIDPPSRNWLGSKATEETIRESGLWNTNHVDGVYEPDFLDLLRRYISSA